MSSFLVEPAAVHDVRNVRGRYRGIDSIRAICATTVVIGHVGFFSQVPQNASQHPRLVVQAAAVAWNGPAAVIVFFIISGFCIHLPYRGNHTLQFKAYIARRLLRISIPALFAIAYTLAILGKYEIINVVLWSIVCEVVYYIFYPGLRTLARTLDWATLIAVSYLVGLALVVTHLNALAQAQNAYTALGLRYTWVLGLPCWLMGCWLAEKLESFPILKTPRLWMLRAVVFVSCLALRVVKFHVVSPFASNCLTLNVFALLGCFWVGCEIRYYENKDAPRILEWVGSWSYSLYLVHPLIAGSLSLLGIAWLTHVLASQHWLVLCSVFPLAYLFHLMVEKPAHIAAVRVSRYLK